ncbi:hypothetical protein J7S33_30555, partial [Saccharothrix algeriensis]
GSPAAGCARVVEGIEAFNRLPEDGGWAARVAGARHLATALAAAAGVVTDPAVRSALETMATDLTTAIGHALTGDVEQFLALSDKVVSDGEALVNACRGTG